MNSMEDNSKNYKEIHEVKIDIGEIVIDKAEIGFSLGYSDGNIPDHFSEMIDEIIESIPQYCSIKAGYVLADVNIPTGRSDGLNIGGKFFKLDKIVTGQLKKSERAALFLCSLGQDLESWSKKLLKAGEIMLSYIVDVAASVTAESVTNLLHDRIKDDMMRTGMKITNRYSPGYCNWSVSEQHLLFSFFPENFCGVKLTESALMVPIKSVSGIVGIGRDVKWKEYICDRCGVKDCTYRVIRLKSTSGNKGKAVNISSEKK